MLCFSDSQTRELIEAVKNNPVLYMHGEGSDQDRGAAWIELAAGLTFECDGQLARLKFKYLRRDFRKYLNLVNNDHKRTSSGPENVDKEVPWRFFKDLQFLTDYVDPYVYSIGNANNQDISKVINKDQNIQEHVSREGIKDYASTRRDLDCGISIQDESPNQQGNRREIPCSYIPVRENRSNATAWNTEPDLGGSTLQGEKIRDSHTYSSLSENRPSTTAWNTEQEYGRSNQQFKRKTDTYIYSSLSETRSCATVSNTEQDFSRSNQQFKRKTDTDIGNSLSENGSCSTAWKTDHEFGRSNQQFKRKTDTDIYSSLSANRPCLTAWNTEQEYGRSNQQFKRKTDTDISSSSSANRPCPTAWNADQQVRRITDSDIYCSESELREKRSCHTSTSNTEQEVSRSTQQIKRERDSDVYSSLTDCMQEIATLKSQLANIASKSCDSEEDGLSAIKYALRSVPQEKKLKCIMDMMEVARKYAVCAEVGPVVGSEAVLGSE